MYPREFLIKNTCTAEVPGRGGKGGRLPPNVLQDHFSISSNSGVKIAGEGGGDKADELGNYNVYEYWSLQLYDFIAFSHDLYGIDSIFFLMAMPPDPRSTYAPRLHNSRSFSRTRRKKFDSWVGHAW